MARRNWYRPQRKPDLIRHLEEQHKPAMAAFYRQMGWTMQSLTEHHDGLHEARRIEPESER